MKVYISELLKEMEYEELEPVLNKVSPGLHIAKERTKRQTFVKIRESYNWIRWIGVAQIICLILLLAVLMPVTAGALIRYIEHGALVSEENRHLIGQETQNGPGGLLVDGDGVYYDLSDGSIIPEDELKDYWTREWPENKYFDSVVDEYDFPNSVVGMPLQKGADGVYQTPEVILLNADVAVMADERDQTWNLEKGDVVTITFSKYPSEVLKQQLLGAGYIKDKVFMEPAQYSEDQEGTIQFTIEEAGDYCFYFQNLSSDYLTLKEGTLQIS